MAASLASCLMVTANRVQLAERAVRCFCAQTWTPKELVIIDDGEQDYAPMLSHYAASIHYHRIDPGAARRSLGELRNISLERAHGEYCAQWDDDDWYHPRRLETQMRSLEQGFDVSVLRHTLMHIDTPQYVDHPFRTALRRGTPGTIVNRRSALRYPSQRKSEDTAYLDRLRRDRRIRVLGPEHSHLFIRCFHGTNTWHRKHFTERLHYTWRNKIDYVWARFVNRDLLTHAAFRLTPEETDSVRLFLDDSRALGLYRI